MTHFPSSSSASSQGYTPVPNSPRGNTPKVGYQMALDRLDSGLDAVFKELNLDGSRAEMQTFEHQTNRVLKDVNALLATTVKISPSLADELSRQLETIIAAPASKGFANKSGLKKAAALLLDTLSKTARREPPSYDMTIPPPAYTAPSHTREIDSFLTSAREMLRSTNSNIRTQTTGFNLSEASPLPSHVSRAKHPLNCFIASALVDGQPVFGMYRFSGSTHYGDDHQFNLISPTSHPDTFPSTFSTYDPQRTSKPVPSSWTSVTSLHIQEGSSADLVRSVIPGAEDSILEKMQLHHLGLEFARATKPDPDAPPDYKAT